MGHWTFQYSNSEFMVADLQGSIVSEYSDGEKYHKYILTDPQVHSTDRNKFGRGNLGEEGMASFFAVHKCNEICEFLQLRRPQNMDQFFAMQLNRMNLNNVPAPISDHTNPTSTSYSELNNSNPHFTQPSAPSLETIAHVFPTNEETTGQDEINSNPQGSSVESISILHIPEAIPVIHEDYTKPIDSTGQSWEAPRNALSEPTSWMKDNEVFKCSLERCKRKFFVFRWRHHCRTCGRVVCHDCSRTKIPLKWRGGNSERVCLECVERFFGVSL